MGTKPRLKFIDGMRGIAACMVMLYHFGSRAGLRPVTEWGYLGVGVFFVISGFVIASTLDRKLSGTVIGRFFARRFVRLDIPYWANIVLAMFLGTVLYRFGGSIHHYSARQVAAHLVYLQDILGIAPINDVYWTLCFEVQFYLTLAFALWAAQRLRVPRGIFQSAIIASIILSVLYNAGFIHSPRGLMFPFWWAFALGGMIFWWRAGQVSGAALLAGFASVSFLPFVGHEAWRITGLLAGLAIVMAFRARAEGRWLSGNGWQFLGRISYSLYLYHSLIGWGAQTLALRYVGPYAALLFGIAVSVLAASGAYVLIEYPAVQLSHRIRTTTPVERSSAEDRAVA
jgi:peptidoglycan/LPS O-acetylase OafA/YrhL